jgi:hypothetical protein
MRLTATFLTALVLAAPNASAERCQLECAGELAPRNGTVIPQNAPFFVGQHAMQRLDQDGWLVAAGPLRTPIRLYDAGPLSVGQRLSVRTLDCADQFIESTFEVGPPARRPTTVGSLTFVESDTPGRPFCDSFTRDGLITLRPTLQASEDLLPWLPLSNFTFRTGATFARHMRWGVPKAEDGVVSLPEVTVACGARLTLVAEIAGQPAMVLNESEATRCRGCAAAPDGALAALLCAMLVRRRQRSNL